MTFSPTLWSWSILVVFSRVTSLFISVCLRWRMYLRSAPWLVRSIMYQPKTIWYVSFPFFLWYIDCTANYYASRIPIHRSASSTYVSYRLYVCTRLPITWCIISMLVLACGLPWEAGLVLIPYSSSIKLFNSFLNEEFSPSVKRDFYWPWIPEQPRSFYQVCDSHRFLVALLRHFKSPSYGVYHCNGF